MIHYKSVFRIRNILLQFKKTRHKLFIENLGSNGFLKNIGAQNELPITFCSDLVCNKTLKARNSTPLHTNF